MHYLEHKKESKDCYMTIKLDMSKAYDRVEWGFIEQVMRKLGFHEKWIDLIMRCITIVSYSVLINGVAHGNIVPSKGTPSRGSSVILSISSMCRWFFFTY